VGVWSGFLAKTDRTGGIEYWRDGPGQSQWGEIPGAAGGLCGFVDATISSVNKRAAQNRIG